MLGRLFSSANSAATSPNGTRPSTAVTFDSDDSYTRGLLYPDQISSSFHSGSSSSNSGGFSDSADLEAARDVRIIVAQDGAGSELKAILYDSRPPHNHHHHLSFEDGPLSPGLGGPYQRRPRRMPASQFQPPSLSHYPSAHASGSVAPEEDMKVLTDCMFGSAPLAYKGPSTKVHILPNIEDNKKGPQPSNSTPSSSRRGSLGLRQAPQNLYGSQLNPPPPPPPPTHSKEKRKSVLITRLFSVVMPPSPVTTTTAGGSYPTIPIANGSRDATPTPASSVGSSHGFPFPKMNGGSNACATSTAASKLMKPPKTAMYAVGLIISLPQPLTLCSSAGSSLNRCCSHQGSFNIYENDNIGHHHEFCCPTPPSFDEDYTQDSSRRGGGGGRGADIAVEDFPPAADDRMDLVTKHWDIITRALSDLQRVVQSRILDSLTTAGIMSPLATQNGFKYRKRIELRQGALMGDDVVRNEVERLRWRVVAGIKVPRVITGQGRWGVWRDEAKWANGRFGGREMNFFFLTLLTAFLGNHTEWLDVLGPEMYRRKHQQQQKVNGKNEDSGILTRTVILSNDKLSARRLIYLLSAFLPSKSLPSWDAIPPPSRTSSFNYLSQSPPVAGISSNSMHGMNKKGGSLRKKVAKKPSKLSMVTGEEGEENVVGWDIPVVVSGNASAAASVLQLPLAGPSVRKTGSAGTLTTAPGSTNVVANGLGSPPKGSIRPNSSGSSASVNLMNTLRRTGTANTSSDSSSAWGSFWSLWGHQNRMGGSAATSETSTHPEDAKRTTEGGMDEEPVDVSELYLEDEDLTGHQHHQPRHQSPPSFPHHYHHQHLSEISESPVRLSIDESDGVVDVDIPFPSIGSASPISSPSSSGWAMPLHSFDGGIGMIGPNISFSTGSLMPPFMGDLDDTSINVAGWMEEERFHPDFTLQAIKPYPEVEAEIKRAMRAEPTPPAASPNTPCSESGNYSDKWIEVCSVLIADTKKLQIKRLRLRRRRKNLSLSSLLSTPDRSMSHLPSFIPGTAPGGGGGGAHNKHLLHPTTQTSSTTTNPYFEDDQEEELLDEEVVCDVDDMLATAIERVIGVVGPKPSTNNTTNTNTTTTNTTTTTTSERGGEGCKCMVLGALEEVVRAVTVDRRGVVGNVLTEGVARWLSGVEEAF